MQKGAEPCERGPGSWMCRWEGAGTHQDGTGHGHRGAEQLWVGCRGQANHGCAWACIKLKAKRGGGMWEGAGGYALVEPRVHGDCLGHMDSVQDMWGPCVYALLGVKHVKGAWDA